MFFVTVYDMLKTFIRFKLFLIWLMIDFSKFCWETAGPGFFLSMIHSVYLVKWMTNKLFGYVYTRVWTVICWDQWAGCPKPSRNMLMIYKTTVGFCTESIRYTLTWLWISKANCREVVLNFESLLNIAVLKLTKMGRRVWEVVTKFLFNSQWLLTLFHFTVWVLWDCISNYYSFFNNLSLNSSVLSQPCDT